MSVRERLALDEILSRCRLIREFTAYGKVAFLNSRESQEATYRCFEVMGEAARRLPISLHKEWPKVPWKEMMNLRNDLIHDYDQVIPEEIWKAVEYKLPVIEKTISRVR